MGGNNGVSLPVVKHPSDAGFRLYKIVVYSNVVVVNMDKSVLSNRFFSLFQKMKKQGLPVYATANSI